MADALAGMVVGQNQFGLDAEMYTRGKAGMADTRGESMVQKHKEKLQKEKEAAGMFALDQLMPHFSSAVRELTLQESHWNVEAACKMLKHFAHGKEELLKPLQKKRKRAQEDVQRQRAKAEALAAEVAAAAAAEAKGNGGGDSGGSSSSDGSSSDSSDDDRRKKRRRSSGKDGKKSRKSSKDSKHKRSSKSSKSSGKDREKHSSREKEKAKRGKDAVAKPAAGKGDDFGKYGILHEIDYNSKSSEFIRWALDVRKVDVEAMSKAEEKELFRDFMEDYNTATLPHRKYYNLDVYEREKAAKEAIKAAKAGGKGKAKTLINPKDDEAAIKAARDADRVAVLEARQLDAYKALQYGNRAQEMREQDLMRQQMSLAYRTGDLAKAALLAKKLKPDEETKKVGGVALPPRRTFESMNAVPEAKK
ncbi:MAG: hypothetical protein WDW36_006176 [Sanguina aurantia]